MVRPAYHLRLSIIAVFSKIGAVQSPGADLDRTETPTNRVGFRAGDRLPGLCSILLNSLRRGIIFMRAGQQTSDDDCRYDNAWDFQRQPLIWFINFHCLSYSMNKDSP